jgi:uncharacterized protein YlaI
MTKCPECKGTGYVKGRIWYNGLENKPTITTWVCQSCKGNRVKPKVI